MANQYVNKVIVNNEIKMDLTEDTITPKTLRKGFTAHDASGAPIVGNESLTDISEDGTNAGPILELNAEGWAEQEQYLGVNLLPFPYTGEDTTEYGVTVTVNDDQSVTFSGPFTGSTTDSLKWSWYGEAGATNNLITPSGATAIKYITVANKTVNRMVVMKFYDSSGNEIVTYSGLQNDTSYSIPSNASGMYIYEMITKLSNTGLLPFTASIMLSAGTTTYPYEPYVGGKPSPSPELPQEIKVARGRNLLNPNTDYIRPIGTPYVSNGLTFIANEDGSVTCNGTATSGTAYNVLIRARAQELYSKYMGKTLVLSGCPSGGSLSTYRMVFQGPVRDGIGIYDYGNGASATVVNASGTCQAYIYIMEGMTCNNLTFYPQLEFGSVPTPFVPRGFIGIEAQRKNLLNLPSASSSGSGYPLGSSRFPISLSAGTYAFSFDSASASGQWVCAFYDANNIKVVGPSARAVVSGTNTVTLTANADITSFEWYINAAYDVSSVQLELGSEATEYEPYYHKTIPIPLPEKGYVASLPDGTSDILKLDGAGGYTWVENTAEKVYDGSESWSKGNGFTYTAKPSDCAETGDGLPSINKLMMDRFKVSYSQQEGAVYASGVNLLFWCGDSYNPSSAEEAKSWATSNPITLLYPLATPQTEQGYVEVWDNDFPLGCTIDIPELRNLNVEYFLYDCITQLADDYYDRTTNDISEAMSQTSDSATHEALAAIAPIEGDISSANYLVGAYLIHDNQLCEVTTPIATGEAITVGTNVVISSVATELGELQVAVQDIIDDPYILPTMSASEKGGAKVGQGLRIDDDILSVDMSSSQATDAGPLISLQAEGWAEQEQYTGKNLWPILTDKTVSDVTATVASDGTITIDGTNTSDSSAWFLWNLEAEISTGTYTVSANNESTNSGVRIVLNHDNSTLSQNVYFTTTDISFSNTYTSTINRIGFVVSSGTTVSNLKIRPQLEAGSTVTDYEPYTGGIPSPNPDYPQDIRVVKGRNLSPVSSVTSNAYGGVEAATTIRLGSVVAGKTYTLSFKVPVNPLIENTSISFYVNVSDTEYSQGYVVLTYAKSVSLTFTATVSGSLRPYTGSGRFSANTEFMSDIQLEEGSVATSYVPYGYLGCEVQGKNLYPTLGLYARRCTLSISDDGVITMTATNTDPSINSTVSANAVYNETCGPLVSVEPNTTYTMSVSNSQLIKLYVIEFDETKTRITTHGSTYGLETNVYTFTTQLSTKYVTLRVGINDTTAGTTFATTIQLELGSVAHAYEPYYHKTIPIPLPSKGFAAALPDGTSDILHLDGAGKWEWESKTNEATVALGITLYDISDGLKGAVFEPSDKQYGMFAAMCDHATSVGGQTPSANTFYENPRNFMFVGDTDDTISDLKAKFDGATILYSASPTTEQGYLDNWDNNIPLHATIDIPELRNIGVECYMDEQASTLNVQWSERLRSEMDSTSTNAVTESLASLAPVENDISSANYPTGSYLIHNNQLYKVTNPIATGETISTSTNVTAATLSDDVKYLNDHPYILPTMSENTKGGAKVGHGLYVENDILSIGGVNDPTDAGPIVELSAKGWAEQLTTTGKNLVVLGEGEWTYSGITFTTHTNASIEISGTATAEIGYASYNYLTHLSAGTYTLSGCTSELQRLNVYKYANSSPTYIGSDMGSGYTFTLSEDTDVYVYPIVPNGKTINTIIYPQLEAGSTATAYEPYTGGAPSPSPSYPQEIKVCRGRNLLPNNAVSQILNGITSTVNSNGSITVNGTATARTVLVVASFNLVAGMYTLSDGGGGNGVQWYLEIHDVTDNLYYSIKTASPTSFTIDATKQVYAYIVIDNGKTVSNVTFYPQLELGSVATPYVPYGYLGCEVQGKNLIPNGLNDSTTYANVTITRKDGVLIFNGTSNGAGGRTNAFYKNQQTTLLAGTYTLSHISSGTGRVNVAVQKLSDNTVLANTTDTRTFTLTEPTMIFVGCNLVANTTYTNLNVKIQLERGTEVTEYEPCRNTTIPIPLPERGYIAALPDGTSDILTIDGAGGYTWELNTNEVLIDGSIACDYVSASTVHTDALRARVAAITGTPSRNAYNGLSSHFTSGSTASWANMGVGQFYLDGSGVILGMPIATIDTTAKVTAWLQSNPVIILYALTTPTTEQGYVDSMPTVPDHATLTCPEMRDLVIRCCADAGAAEISQAWAKRFKMELDELREIVNGLASNS